MELWRPDPTFYPSPKLAGQAPPEKLGYVALLNPRQDGVPDAIAVVDLDPASSSYASVVGKIDMPNRETSCTTSAGMRAAHASALMRRTRTRRTLFGCARNPVVENPHHRYETGPEEAEDHQGHRIRGSRRAHRLQPPAHRPLRSERNFPERARVSDGEGPGGIFILDPDSFEVLGKWEIDRGPQYFGYDFWWHLGHDTLITSEWEHPAWSNPE